MEPLIRLQSTTLSQMARLDLSSPDRWFGQKSPVAFPEKASDTQNACVHFYLTFLFSDLDPSERIT